MDENRSTEKLEKIGQRIREMRKRAGYTSYETFANDYNLPRKNYWRIEKGYNFTMSSLLVILEIHKMSLEDFFDGLE